MKLYATITSERATKGQGGNKKLITTFLVKDDIRNTNDEVARATFTTLHNGSIMLQFLSLVDEKICTILLPERYNIKGKQQKDECKSCHGENPEGCTYC